MVRIWREQIALLGAVDTGALYRSTVAVSMTADGKYTSISLSQKFNLYGLFVDYGTGSNTPRGNPGDISCKRGQSRACSSYAERSRNRCEAYIGRDNARKRSSQSAFVVKRRKNRWFSRKYFASVMNLREFFADNLGKDMADTISNALTRDISRRFIT